MKLKNGLYSNLLIHNYSELKEDEYLSNIVSEIKTFYDTFLKNSNEEGIDNDTSCEVRMDGEIDNNVLYPSKACLEFSFIDELNHEVCQTVTVNFMDGSINIFDDDVGFIYSGTNEEFNLY